MRHVTLSTSVLAFSAFIVMPVNAATQHVSALGATYGWYSDETKNTSGTLLVGTNSSYTPYYGAGTNANDVAIAQQINFTDTGTSTTAGTGVLVLDGTTDNRGKSSVKYINTTTGLGSGANLANFTASYRWFMDNYTTSRTPALSLAVAGTNGLSYSLVYFSSPVSNSTPQAWNLSSVTANTTTTTGLDGWFMHGNGAPGGTVGGRSLNAILADATYGAILSGGTVVATGFHIGTYQKNCRVGIDWVENSLLNGGDRIDFGVAVPAPGAAALIGLAGLVATRRRRN
jgi:MYXO-CTERM domain-containing protein